MTGERYPSAGYRDDDDDDHDCPGSYGPTYQPPGPYYRAFSTCNLCGAMVHTVFGEASPHPSAFRTSPAPNRAVDERYAVDDGPTP